MADVHVEDDWTELHARVHVECHTTAQADVVIETLKRFGVFDTEDFSIETDPFELPAGWVYVASGEKKGRRYHFGVDPDGCVHS